MSPLAPKASKPPTSRPLKRSATRLEKPRLAGVFFRPDYGNQSDSENVMKRLAWLMVGLFSGGQAMAWDGKRFHKPESGELKQQLNAEQYHVTQENGTEWAFRNAYW